MEPTTILNTIQQLVYSASPIFDTAKISSKMELDVVNATKTTKLYEAYKNRQYHRYGCNSFYIYLCLF